MKIRVHRCLWAVHMFMCNKYDGIRFYDVIKGEIDSILSLPTEIRKFAKEI